MLPAGDWEASCEELRASILAKGPGEEYPNWDAGWRLKLIDNLEVLAGQLWQVGVNQVFVDGSFAEDKDHPNDIDGYLECGWHRLVSGELQDESQPAGPAPDLEL